MALVRISDNPAASALIGTEVFPAIQSGSDVKVTATQIATFAASGGAPVQYIYVACSDETTALTVGTAKITFRNPFASVFTVTHVKANLTTAQSAGSIFTIDINESGTTILSTKITIDNTELTSETAATPPVVSDSSIAADAQMTVDIDQVGTSGATGLKVCIVGTI